MAEARIRAGRSGRAALAPGPCRWRVTEGARGYAKLPGHVADRLAELCGRRVGETGDGIVVARASEIIREREKVLPGWIGTGTFYLIFRDVSVPALMRLPTILRLHKPDLRLHVTADPRALRRLVLARSGPVPAEGIVDAYVVEDELVLVLGDLTVRSFPRSEVPGAGELSPERFADFELDEDGSHLRWAGIDLDLGSSSLLQAVDPSYRADVEIDRLEREDTGGALRAMREERGLRQRDVKGLSTRQVRRLEKGRSRLTAEAARCFAGAFGLSMEEFLERLSVRLGERAERVEDPGEVAAR